MGIDVRQPRLAWVDRHRGARQAQTPAYHLLVASSLVAETRGDQWGQRRWRLMDPAQVVYNGKRSRAITPTGGKVRWWDKDGSAERLQRAASFDVALLFGDDWKGQWIGR